jgi:hypothetical protein
VGFSQDFSRLYRFGRNYCVRKMGRLTDLASAVPVVETETKRRPVDKDRRQETGEQRHQREADAAQRLRTPTFWRLYKERRQEERYTSRSQSFKLWRFR